jgi:LTXXQ motif family protein
MAQVILRAGGLVVAAIFAVALLPAAGALSAAAAIGGAATIGPPARSVLPAQASPGAPAPNLEANIARIHQRLQITPAQEPHFAAFANTMRENSRIRPAAPAANSTAVDDLRVAIQVSEQELGALRRLLPPLQALYASLSPAQQRIADQLFRQGPGE